MDNNTVLYYYLLNQIYKNSMFSPHNICNYIAFKNTQDTHYEAFEDFIESPAIKETIELIVAKDYIVDQHQRKIFKEFNSEGEKQEDLKMLIKRDFYHFFTWFKGYKNVKGI